MFDCVFFVGVFKKFQLKLFPTARIPLWFWKYLFCIHNELQPLSRHLKYKKRLLQPFFDWQFILFIFRFSKFGWKSRTKWNKIAWDSIWKFVPIKNTRGSPEDDHMVIEIYWWSRPLDRICCLKYRIVKWLLIYRPINIII